MYNEAIIRKLTYGDGQFYLFVSSEGGVEYRHKNEHPIKIIKIEVLKPEKVVRFTFEDNTQIKTICDDKDTFSLTDACYVALAKYISKKNLTSDGVWYFAQELKYYKIAQKIVAKTIKTYFKQLAELKLAETKKEQERIAAIHHREKKAAYKKRRKERANS